MANSKKATIRNPEKYDYAFLLFMKKMSQKDICEKVGVTPPTLSKWIEKGGWREKVVAKTISVDNIISKTLLKINDLLDSDSFNADSFSKAVNQLKTLKQGATVDDKILTLMDFGDWLIAEMPQLMDVDETFVKKVTSLQDIYILKQLKNGGK